MNTLNSLEDIINVSFKSYASKTNIAVSDENFVKYFNENQEYINVLIRENTSGKQRIAITEDSGCNCGCENQCYYVIVHETEKMDDEGVDSFMLHGDEYEDDNTGDNAHIEAIKKATGGH